MTREFSSRIGIIVPAHNEEEALPLVLQGLKEVLDPAKYVIAVGANGCTDATADVARQAGATVGETEQRGYGYGCQAAIDALNKACPDVSAYVFFAADGANDPREIATLVGLWMGGHDLVLGSRTDRPANYSTRFAERRISNLLLGLYCSVLAGHLYRDLGPFRLIDRELFEAMGMCEWTWGWTIEPQIKAVQLNARICETPVSELPRVAGEQKISGVSLRHSLRIGSRIALAGWRVARSCRGNAKSGICLARDAA